MWYWSTILFKFRGDNCKAFSSIELLYNDEIILSPAFSKSLKSSLILSLANNTSLFKLVAIYPLSSCSNSFNNWTSSFPVLGSSPNFSK